MNLSLKKIASWELIVIENYLITFDPGPNPIKHFSASIEATLKFDQSE